MLRSDHTTLAETRAADKGTLESDGEGRVSRGQCTL
jgi:hypothetical protein